MGRLSGVTWLMLSILLSICINNFNFSSGTATPTENKSDTIPTTITNSPSLLKLEETTRPKRQETISGITGLQAPIDSKSAARLNIASTSVSDKQGRTRRSPLAGKDRYSSARGVFIPLKSYPSSSRQKQKNSNSYTNTRPNYGTETRTTAGRTTYFHGLYHSYPAPSNFFDDDSYTDSTSDTWGSSSTTNSNFASIPFSSFVHHYYHGGSSDPGYPDNSYKPIMSYGPPVPTKPVPPNPGSTASPIVSTRSPPLSTGSVPTVVAGTAVTYSGSLGSSVNAPSTNYGSGSGSSVVTIPTGSNNNVPGSTVGSTGSQRRFSLINRNLPLAVRFKESFRKDVWLSKKLVLNPDGVTCLDLCTDTDPSVTHGLLGLCTSHYCNCRVELLTSRETYRREECPIGHVFDPVRSVCDVPHNTILCSDNPVPRSVIEEDGPGIAVTTGRGGGVSVAPSGEGSTGGYVGASTVGTSGPNGEEGSQTNNIGSGRVIEAVVTPQVKYILLEPAQRQPIQPQQQQQQPVGSVNENGQLYPYEQPPSQHQGYEGGYI